MSATTGSERAAYVHLVIVNEDAAWHSYFIPTERLFDRMVSSDGKITMTLGEMLDAWSQRSFHAALPLSNQFLDPDSELSIDVVMDARFDQYRMASMVPYDRLGVTIQGVYFLSDFD